MLSLHSSFFNISIPRDHPGVLGIRPISLFWLGGFLQGVPAPGFATPAYFAYAFQSLSLSLLVRLTLWSPPGVLYCVKSGSKFLPSFRSGLG